ncbi:MAG TPA: T9SS type A sorting domain-containing protein [Bacteroidales bacterium]|nr:T9SS type A sorting domain-containing protein [Bacteroidales bacterium]
MMIAKFFYGLLFYFFLSQIYGQSLPRYWIAFTDKQYNTYSLAQPQQFLSQRALNRRANYGIDLDSTDLPVSSFYIDSLRSLGLQIINTSKWLNGVTVATSDTVLMDTIDNLNFVAYHQKTKPLLLKINNIERSNKSLSAIRATDYGLGTSQITMLRGNFLHQLGYRGEGMLIAVLDAGFYNVNQMHLFDSLRNDNRIIGTYDFVENDTNVYDDHSHGMSVLSTMATNDPGYFIGTAPKASFLLLRTEDANTEYLIEEDNWVVAAEYADSVGADLINTSLGYTVFDDTLQNHTYADMNGITSRIALAADMAFEKGIFVVCSAGNSGDDPWHYISTPADAFNALSVGAVDLSGNYANFSSTGPSADGRIKPNVASPGADVMVAFTNDSIYSGNGTSFSSPITCGLLACLWQAFPDKTNNEIKEAIEQSASQYEHPDSLLGYGIPDFEKAFFILSGITIQEIDEIKFLLYPNPFRNELSIDIFVQNINNLEITVSTLLGKRVYHYSAQGNILKTINITELNNLQKGVYLVEIRFNNNIYQRKVIKL